MNQTCLAGHLHRMQRASADASRFTNAMNKTQFLADKLTQQAVVISLINVGDAATMVIDNHAAFADRHPEVQWRRMQQTRDQIACGRSKTDLDMVWTTVRTALPGLDARLRALDHLAR